ncbi:MAG: YifB family Mg chelatase-like AAA ATPase, partial [Firmicutes bacterium]|nr:YifB family Mg chelatase-like AAA ATPase [Bacillota bacterium]
LSSSLVGIDGFIVDVEADLSRGLPAFDIVGLPDSAVKESKERVRTAIKNSGIEFPVKRITINLAPANIRKEGVYFDLPIALAILMCIDEVPENSVKDTVVVGELSLDGTIKPVNGVLSIIHSAKEQNYKKCIVPVDNAQEAALVEGMEVIGADTLSNLIAHLKKPCIAPTKVDIEKLFSTRSSDFLDFSDVKGQENVKRAFEIAAAGMHNLIMVGPPGSGKTMMARRLPSILPDLTFEESIEITKIHSVAGLLKNNTSLITERPFRSPHHTISNSAMVGGGRIPRPGEVSLAHNGVLFLDELPEFQRNVLEELRQPLEDNEVTISRVNGTMTFPSNLMLVASCNPCPCGFHGYSDKCRCTENEINRYIGKISGPLLDRIDIQCEAAAVNYNDLAYSDKSESSAQIRERVVKAHKIQQERYKNEPIYFNSQLSSSQVDKYCVLGDDERKMLKTAFEKFNLSMRAYHKILKIARTIADLDSSENINVRHAAEAIQLRNLDRQHII